jgi:hypothetical protein
MHITRNLLFDFKHGADCTPIPPVRDIVKQFPSGAPQRSEFRTSTAEIARYSATFATLLLAEPFVDRFRCLSGPPPIYPVGIGKSAIRPSIAPNRSRVRCPSASSNQ